MAGTASPFSQGSCPAQPSAGSQDPVNAPDRDNALCYPLAPAVLQLTQLDLLLIVIGVSGPVLEMTLLEAGSASFATYTEAHVGSRPSSTASSHPTG